MNIRTSALAFLALPLAVAAQQPAATPMVKWTDLATAQAAAKKDGKPLLIDVYTSWCGPCRMQGPILEEVAAAVGDKGVIAKINIDENQKTPMTYGIRGIPTLMVFKGGKVEATQIGAVGKGQLTQMIDKAI